jgi:alpha-amylase
MLLSNQGTQGKPYSLMLPVTYNAGTAVTEVLNCKTYLVNEKGELHVDMDKGEPRVLFPSKLLEGSGLCGYSSSNISYADIRTGRGSGSSASGARNKGSANIKQPLLLTLVLSLMLLGLV